MARSRSAVRATELLATLIVGKGVLYLLAPRQHFQLWRSGPRSWERTMDVFLRRPSLARLTGLAAFVGGIWLARRQWRKEFVTPSVRLREQLREVLTQGA